MINFIHKFLNVLTDQELEHLLSSVFRERSQRDQIKRDQFGNQPELNEHEQRLASPNATHEYGSKIDAILAYRLRTGHSLKTSKDAVEYWLSRNPPNKHGITQAVIGDVKHAEREAPR